MRENVTNKYFWNFKKMYIQEIS